MFHHVYVLKSAKDGKFYIGLTNNLRRRIMEHNRGDNFSSKGRRPLVLAYCETFRDREDAETRERFFKTGWGRQYLNRVLKNYLQSEKFRRG